ncbi:MAG: pantoate--beta-alanine ligase [Bacteroidales bacterium]|nr:pantoate--beta-alanine ligase [Bacteroidales bacterium]
MRIIETAEAIRTYRSSLQKEHRTVGLVPTMGALHTGHLSLVEEAQRNCDSVIVSIFVNPTQFNDPLDLKNYPRTLDEDLKMLAERKVDAVFVPGIHDIYPHPDIRKFDFGKLEEVMEGKHRPGHFNGVAQVVSILFDLIHPQMAFFGQKDYQQLAIIRELVRQLNLRIDIVGCPIIREENGLAMSSRNRLLTEQERSEAALIHDTLRLVIEKKDELSPKKLSMWATRRINSNPRMKVEYLEIVGTNDLQSIENWSIPGDKIVCTAVKINSVRLIDNMIFP